MCRSKGSDRDPDQGCLRPVATNRCRKIYFPSYFKAFGVLPRKIKA